MTESRYDETLLHHIQPQKCSKWFESSKEIEIEKGALGVDAEGYSSLKYENRKPAEPQRGNLNQYRRRNSLSPSLSHICKLI